MKFARKILLPAFALAALQASAASSVLSVSDSSLESTLIMPRSVETDTKAMLEEWYLKNYAALDYEADKKSAGDLSDAVIIERL